MVKITDAAIVAIKESMLRAKLPLDQYALHLYIDKGNLSLTFINDVKNAKFHKEIWILIDDAVERHHQNNPLVVDFVTNGKKQGLIFLEESQYDRINNRESIERNQESDGGTESGTR